MGRQRAGVVADGRAVRIETRRDGWATGTAEADGSTLRPEIRKRQQTVVLTPNDRPRMLKTASPRSHARKYSKHIEMICAMGCLPLSATQHVATYA